MGKKIGIGDTVVLGDKEFIVTGFAGKQRALILQDRNGWLRKLGFEVLENLLRSCPNKLRPSVSS